jgi:hypothetical protein
LQYYLRFASADSRTAALEESSFVKRGTWVTIKPKVHLRHNTPLVESALSDERLQPEDGILTMGTLDTLPAELIYIILHKVPVFISLFFFILFFYFFLINASL